MKQTCFLEGCRRDGFLAKVKGFDLDALHAGEHYGKASIPLLVLPRRVGARATGCHCKEEQTNSKSLMIKFFRCKKKKRHHDVCCVSNAFSQSDLAARSLGVKKVFESNSFNFELISVLKPLKRSCRIHDKGHLYLNYCSRDRDDHSWKKFRQKARSYHPFTH